MEPRKFGIVDFGESKSTTFCIIHMIDTGLGGLLLVVDGRWRRGMFLSRFIHFERGVQVRGCGLLIDLVVVCDVRAHSLTSTELGDEEVGQRDGPR